MVPNMALARMIPKKPASSVGSSGGFDRDIDCTYVAQLVIKL